LKRYVTMLVLVLLSAITSAANAYRLPDTGQTKCYRATDPYDEIPCAGTGQDGAYPKNPMSFTDNGDGTVTDNNTGLIWQKCSVGQNNDSSCSGTAATYNWYQASGTYDLVNNPSSQNVCGALTLGGYSDWRLPSKKELTSIVDYSIPYPGPTIKQSNFPNTVASNYWSSTKLAYGPYDAWDVDFGVGDVYYYIKVAPGYFRCVRGGQ